MNPIELQVTFLDGTSTKVEAVAADLIAFESRFDMSVARLDKDARITHLFFMAWHVLKRTGQTSDEFEKWVETVSGVGAVDVKK